MVKNKKFADGSRCTEWIWTNIMAFSHFIFKTKTHRKRQFTNTKNLVFTMCAKQNCWSNRNSTKFRQIFPHWKYKTREIPQWIWSRNKTLTMTTYDLICIKIGETWLRWRIKISFTAHLNRLIWGTIFTFPYDAVLHHLSLIFRTISNSKFGLEGNNCCWCHYNTSRGNIKEKYMCTSLL